MDLEQEFKKETGFDAYIDNNLEPKIPMGYYVEWLEAKIDYAHSSLQLNEKEEQLNRIKRIEWLKGVTEYTIWADYVPNGNSICDKFEDELKELQNL